MPRIPLSEVDNYRGSGGSFFSLKDDKDMAVVRFMYDRREECQAAIVHQVILADGTKRYVNCLRFHNEPIEKCPICASGNHYKTKLFLILFNEDTEEVQIWERGSSFRPKMESLFDRYAKDKPLVSTIFEIERHGKKGDTNTVYETYNVETDDLTLEDFPEVPNIYGTIILEKTAEEMEYFLKYKEFEDAKPTVANRSELRKRTPARSSERTERSPRSTTRRRAVQEEEPTRRRPSKHEDEEEAF